MCLDNEAEDWDGDEDDNGIDSDYYCFAKTLLFLTHESHRLNSNCNSNCNSFHFISLQLTFRSSSRKTIR